MELVWFSLSVGIPIGIIAIALFIENREPYWWKDRRNVNDRENRY